MEFGTFSFTILRGIKKVFRPPKNTHTNNFGGGGPFKNAEGGDLKSMNASFSF